MERLMKESTPVRVGTEEKMIKKGRVQEGEMVRRVLNFEEMKEEGKLDEQKDCTGKINIIHDSIPGLSKSHNKLQRNDLSKDRKSCIIT